jgi:hypothetical protein
MMILLALNYKFQRFCQFKGQIQRKRPVSPTYSSDPFLAILSADSGQIGVRLN